MKKPTSKATKVSPSEKSDMEDALFRACEACNPSVVEDVGKLIKRGVDVNAAAPSFARGSALTNAAYKGNAELCQLLIDHGAEVNFRSGHGYAALHECLTSEPPLPERDSEGERDYESAKYKKMIADLELRRIQVVRTLLENEADPNITDRNGVTPMHGAVKTENKNALALMIKHGGDPDQENDEAVSSRQMALEQKNGWKAVIDAALALRAIEDAMKASLAIDKVMKSASKVRMPA